MTPNFQHLICYLFIFPGMTIIVVGPVTTNTIQLRDISGINRELVYLPQGEQISPISVTGDILTLTGLFPGTRYIMTLLNTLTDAVLDRVTVTTGRTVCVIEALSIFIIHQVIFHCLYYGIRVSYTMSEVFKLWVARALS